MAKSCPFCHSPPLPLGVGLPTAYACGTVGLSRSKECRVNEAVALCRRHDSPAVNTGAHALAGKLLAVLVGEEREHR